MKGIKHYFSRECKKANVSIVVGEKWCCRFKSGGRNRAEITVPAQTSDQNIFFGFHELGHAMLHGGRTQKEYDNLLCRIEMEREADGFAWEMCAKYGVKTSANNSTMGLIALHLAQGGTYQDFSVEVDDNFVTLKRFGTEIFSNFFGNLPMHPAF